MSVQRRVNWISQQRVDVPDMRSIESAASNDFDQLIQAFITGTTQGYVLRGFEISMTGAIGGASNGLQMIVDPGAVLHIKASQSGTFLMVPPGTLNQQLNSATNPTVVEGAFAPSAINYVGLDYERFIDDTTSAQVYLWDPTTNSETTKTAPRAQILRYKIKITQSTWAGNVLPIATVTTDAGNNVISITDCRWQLFRLGQGGASPNPFYVYPWNAQAEGRTESPTTSTSNSVNPFHGGDKMLATMKDWMDAVMTSIKEIKGTAFWYSAGGSASIMDLFHDAAGSLLTGRGRFSHDATTPGLLTWTSDLLLRSIVSPRTFTIPAGNVTLGEGQVAYITLVRNQDFQTANTFTFTAGSPTVTGALTVTGINAGDFIRGIADPESAWRQVSTVVGTTITLTTNYPLSSVQKAIRSQGPGYTVTVADPQNVPDDADVYWLAKREIVASSTAIAASPTGAVRVSGTSTIQTTGPHGFVVGQTISVAGVLDTSFNGIAEILTVPAANQATILNEGPDATSGSGTLSAAAKVYLRWLGEIDQGEEKQIDDTVSGDTLRFIGARGETDNSPNYFSNNFVADGDNLVRAISKLDQHTTSRAGLKVIGGGVLSNASGNTGFNIGTGFNSFVFDFAVQSDSDIIVGGAFTTFNGNTRNRLVRLNGDGSDDTLFYTNLGTGFGGSVQTVAIQADGKILVAGNFTTFNGNTRNRMVRLNSDGTEDTAFYTNLGTGFNANIEDLAIQTDGDILVGGSFTTLNGNARSRLVRLNSDGTEDTAFYTNLGTGFSAALGENVNCVTLQTDGDILVGGAFSTFNGSTRNRLIRLNSDGTQDTAFYTNLGTGFSPGDVEDVEVQSTTQIIVGGGFTSFNGNARNRLVRLNLNGTEDATFYTNLGTGVSGTIEKMSIQSDDKILLGGAFTSINGVAHGGVARLNSNGTDDSTFTTNTGTGFGGGLQNVMVQPGGRILCGGNFTTFNGNTRNRLVRLNADGTEETQTITSGATLSFTAPMYLERQGLSYTDNTIPTGQSPIAFPNDYDAAWVTPNTATGGPNLNVTVTALSLVPTTAVIIARREGTDVIVGSSSTRLTNGQSTELYAQESIQSRNSLQSENYMRSDDPITWTGTQIQFTTNIVFEVLNTRTGTTKTFTILVAGSPIALTNGQLAYITIDREAVSSNVTPTITSVVPTVTSQNLQHIILFKRVDANGAGYLHFPMNGLVLNPGQTVRLGASGSGTGGGDAPQPPIPGYNWLEVDTFDALPTSADGKVTTTGYTNATFNIAKDLYKILCDKSKTVAAGTTGTTFNINSAPAGFTVAIGDVVYLTSGARLNQWRRISAIISPTSFTLDSAFTGGDAAVADTLMVSQAVWTKDLVNFGSASDLTRARDFFSGNVTQIAVDYFDSLATDDNVPDFVSTARVVMGASNSGVLADTGVPLSNTFGNQIFTRVAEPGTINNFVLSTNASQERLHLVFFANPNNGTVTTQANILKYEANFFADSSSLNSGVLNDALCFSDNSTTPFACTVATPALLTRVTLDWSYSPGINAGGPDGQLEVWVDGKEVSRFISGAITPITDLYYTEQTAADGIYRVVQFTKDLSGTPVEIKVVRRFGVYDVSTQNSARVSALSEATVGTAAQVTAGIATHTSYQAAHDAIVAGGKIFVQNNVTLSGNTTVTKRHMVEGKGPGSTLTGNLIVASGAAMSVFVFLRIDGDITFNAGADGCFMTHTYQTSGKVFSNDVSNVNQSFDVTGE